MDDRIRALESLQEQIDAESLYLIKQQQGQLRNVEGALAAKQGQLAAFEAQLRETRQEADVLGKTLASQVQAQDAARRALQQTSIENAHFKQNLALTGAQNEALRRQLAAAEAEKQSVLNNAIQQNMNAGFLEQ